MAVCYGTAAYVLRGPLQIDLGLRRRQDVVRYVFVTMAAAVVATVIGVACLVADHSIARSEVWVSSLGMVRRGWDRTVGDCALSAGPCIPLGKKRSSHRKWRKASGKEQRAGSKIVRVDPTIVAEAVGQIAAILAILWVMFGPRLGSRQLFYLSFVPIIWIAMRQGIRRVVSGLLALNFGIVVAMHIFPPVAGVPIENRSFDAGRVRGGADRRICGQRAASDCA